MSTTPVNGDLLPLEFMARREDWQNGISVYMRKCTFNVHTAFAEPVVMRVVEPDEFMPAPMLRLSIHEAQQLIDELWQCGLRPTEGTGSAGSLAATQAHLKDMRAIAFDLLQMKVEP